MESYDREVIAAVSSLTAAEFEKRLWQGQNLSMTTVGHKLYLVRRVGIEASGMDIEVSPISEYVSSLLVAQARIFTRAEQLHIFNLFNTTPMTRAMTGTLFEAFGQKEFYDYGINISIYPMIRLDDAPEARRKNAWHSIYWVLEDPTLERQRQNAMMEKTTLNIKTVNFIPYDDTFEPLEVPLDTLFIPKASNQVAIGSFIVHDGHLYMFQFTVGKTHGIKGGLPSFLAKWKYLPEEKNRSFIFVIPDDNEGFKSSYSSTGIKPFTTTLSTKLDASTISAPS